MNRFCLFMCLIALLAPIAVAGAEDVVVVEVQVEGTIRLDRETILYYSQLKPGTTYDPDQARLDLRSLWDTGFFEDVRLEKEAVAGGVNLVWHVVERPILASLAYEGNDGVSEEDIQDMLKDAGIELRDGSPFGLSELERARTLIEDLHHEKGYRFVKVETEIEEDSEAGLKVVVRIDEGSKVKIAVIEFEGNRAFDDGQLRKALKKTKESSLLCIIGKKCVFNEANFREDMEHLRDYYYDRGYVNFAAGEPRIEPQGEGKERRLHVMIPVTEGEQFRVGEVSIEGNTAYPESALLALNRLEKNEPFSRKAMNEGRQDMSEVYGVKGYFNVLIVPIFNQHEGENVVDVSYKITENELYYIHRIAFRGNTTTKDKVIRRQMRIAEGELFNTARFKRSLFRIYQLGYFKDPQPKIDPSDEDPTKLDVTIDLQEQGKNDIRLGGGVSGVEGFFGTFAFSTRNLFGSGNSMTVDIQSGRRVKQYQLSYLDPYIFDKPVSGGVDFFNRSIEYSQFERKGTGGEVQLGLQLADFWFLRTAYRYEDVDQRPRTRFDADGMEIPVTETEFLLYTDNRRVSSLSPVVVYSSIDNPVRPWKGLRQVISMEYSGGILGGTSNLVKPRLDTTAYVPLSDRVGLALHAEVSYVKGFGGLNVPLFEKFFLGGEQSIRGYSTFQIGPRDTDDQGNDVLLGGDKMAVFNAELQFRIASPVSVVLFADAGNAFAEGERLSLTNLEKSFGGELRFWTPFLQAPFRLIYSYVPDPLVRNGVEDPRTDFTFSIGTTF